VSRYCQVVTACTNARPSLGLTPAQDALLFRLTPDALPVLPLDGGQPAYHSLTGCNVNMLYVGSVDTDGFHSGLRTPLGLLYGGTDGKMQTLDDRIDSERAKASDFTIILKLKLECFQSQANEKTRKPLRVQYLPNLDIKQPNELRRFFPDEDLVQAFEHAQKPDCLSGYTLKVYGLDGGWNAAGTTTQMSWFRQNTLLGDLPCRVGLCFTRCRELIAPSRGLFDTVLLKLRAYACAKPEEHEAVKPVRLFLRNQYSPRLLFPSYTTHYRDFGLKLDLLRGAVGRDPLRLDNAVGFNRVHPQCLAQLCPDSALDAVVLLDRNGDDLGNAGEGPNVNQLRLSAARDTIQQFANSDIFDNERNWKAEISCPIARQAPDDCAQLVAQRSCTGKRS
jgi:hypothetical protein